MDIEIGPASLGKDENGNVIVTQGVKEEMVEELRSLLGSRQWRVYRALLLQAKEGYLSAMMAENDTNKMLKLAGQYAGVNFAINQLVHLVRQHDKQQAKRVTAESKKQPQTKG